MPRKALVGNAADESQVENAKREEKSQRDQELDDLRSLVGTPFGRRFVWRVLTHCQCFTTPFGVDDRSTNHNIGRSDVGRFLLREITLADPSALVSMMTEFNPFSE